jgi:GNAT superfamily N-acetyltransferase
MVPELSVSVEPWSQMRNAILPLWDELALEAKQSTRTPLPVGDRALYDQAAAESALVSVSARNGVRLVGFWLAFLSPHPHHVGRIVCAGDLVYIKPKHRGGWTLAKMLRTVRDEAKARGAHALYVNAPIQMDFEPLMRRFGLLPVETQYSVWF